MILFLDRYYFFLIKRKQGQRMSDTLIKYSSSPIIWYTIWWIKGHGFNILYNEAPMCTSESNHFFMLMI